MGLRSRIKDRVKSLLGEAPPPEPAAAVPAAPPVARPAAPAAASAPPPPPPQADKERLAAQARPAAPAEAPRIDADKKREARLKAKKAVLQFLIKEGGEAGMKEMHDFSERRYFVAHKAFSDLMEEYIEEGLIRFDQDTYRATLTDEGRAWVDAATDIRTREKM